MSLYLADDIFESVVEQALIKAFKQNAKSIRSTESDWQIYPNSTCAYRSEAGCCIVGHMISDEFYNKGLEGAAVGGTSVIHAIKNTIASTLSVEFERFRPKQITTLADLQYIHDEADSIDHVENMWNVLRTSNTIEPYTKVLFMKAYEKFKAKS